MATEIIKLTGNAYWAKIYTPDVYMGNTSYKLNFYPENEAELKKFTDSGIQKTIKEDENGKFFELIRPAYKMIKGTVVNFTGPVVLDKENKVIVDFVSKVTGKRVYSYDAKDQDNVERRGSPILIGNGSKVEVEVAVYDTVKGKGHRLEQIKVLDLVEYSSSNRPLPELSNLIKEEQLKVREEIEQAVDDGKPKKTPW